MSAESSPDAGGGAAAREPAGPGRRETLGAAGLIAVLVLLFLSTPLARLGEGAWSTTDLLNGFRLLTLDPERVPANRLLSDPATQMQPWALFARAELAQGRLPTWNPYNGAGQPLIANYQSGVFSPFNLPLLVLPLPGALIASAFLKLFALGLCTWLFLRQIGCAFGPALVGAAAFAFGGHNIYCIAYPHPGALIVLPAGLFCAERVLQAAERGARSAGAWLGLIAAVATGALAGHPEPFFFGALLLALWCALRLVGHARARGLAAAARTSGALLAAAALGLALAAPQILPFVEYLQHAAALSTRLHNQEAFKLELLPLWIFPDVLGNPASPYLLKVTTPLPNFEGANMATPGGAALVFGLGGLVFARRDRRVRLFALVVLVWFLYGYDIGGLGAAAAHVPLLAKMPINRSQPVWLFSLACLAALGLEQLRREPPCLRPLRALTLLLAGLGVLGFALAGADGLLISAYRQFNASSGFLAHAPEHLGALALSTLAAVLVLALATLRGGARAAALACAAAFALIGYQNAWRTRDYNPTIPREQFFAHTDAIDELARLTQGRTVAALCDSVVAEANVAYGVGLLSNYDAMSVARFDKLLHNLFAAGGPVKEPRSATRNALIAAGCEYVLARGRWPRVETDLAEQLYKPGRKLSALPLVAGRELVQQFTASRDGLQAVMLLVAGFPGAGALDVRLETEDGRQVVHERLELQQLFANFADAGEIGASLEPVGASAPQQVPIAFAREADSRGRVYRLRIACPEGRERACPVVWSDATLQLAGSRLVDGAQPRPGALFFDASYAYGELEHLADLRNLHLYRFRGPTRYFELGRAVGVEDENAALVQLRDPSYDAGASVLLEGLPADAPSGATRAAEPVSVIEEQPARVRLRCTGEGAGWIVACRAYYPGWVALDEHGEELPIYAANGAFMAFPARTQQIELVYRPLSLRAGFALAGLALLLALWGFARLRRAT